MASLREGRRRKGEKIRKKMSDGILPLFPVGVGDERNEQSEVRGELKVGQREESRWKTERLARGEDVGGDMAGEGLAR